MTELPQLLDPPAVLSAPKIDTFLQPLYPKELEETPHERYMGLMSRVVELSAAECQEFHDLMELHENARCPAFTIEA